ncbi:C2H2 finger domain-containing protein [Phlyctema vagabunda]|uniref:C2H2 finger domain-containing protein n=1 Tax=Phlyctema vagabunda TaxID=108571 RepID=A0ABR4PLR2_9HELO
MGFNHRFEPSAQPHYFHTSVYTNDNTEHQDLWRYNIDPALQDSQVHGWYELEQPLLQRWAAEPEKMLFTASSTSGFPFQDFSANFGGPTAPFPQAVTGRMDSSRLSQDLSSTCSSVRSPRAEPEYHSDHCSQTQEDYNHLRATGHINQGLPDWSEPPARNIFSMSNYPCVNLSQVQAYPDVGSEPSDEGYIGMDTKGDFTEAPSQSPDCNAIPIYSTRHDEGLGASIKDEASPKREDSDYSNDSVDDADGDEDIEIDTIVCEYPEPEENSDTEYNPRSSQSRKRQTSTKTNRSITKRPQISRISRISRISKDSKMSSSLTCKSCPKRPIFADANTLRRHVAVSHSRFFVCVFSFAGCKSTFASKNEWKRHVSSQHLNLCYWACTQDNCSGAQFNRKDLYTQHLRRMHAPFAVKRQGKKSASWEERVRELQTSALRERRSAPSQLACTKEGCDMFFEGSSAWDDRMEHVGKHLEKGAVLDQGADTFLTSWAQETRVIERKGDEWQFCKGPGRPRNTNDARTDPEDEEDEEEDDDAECEDE